MQTTIHSRKLKKKTVKFTESIFSNEIKLMENSDLQKKPIEDGRHTFVVICHRRKSLIQLKRSEIRRSRNLTL